MIEDWLDAQWIHPGISVVVCRLCGSWVPPEHCTRHEEWHERLRKALICIEVDRV
jgi:hypothetical protein